MLEPLLHSSIEALGRMDACKLEALCVEAEQMAAQNMVVPVEREIAAQCLKQTLCELLKTTDENLRLLRALRGLRVKGLASDDWSHGGSQWVR